MSIQSSINSIVNQAATISTIGKAAKEFKNINKETKKIKEALKENGKDIKGSIEGLKVDREQQQAYEDYIKAMTNPNLRNIINSQKDTAVNNALMKERNTKYKQSMMERAQTLAKQKQDVPKIKEELRLGKEKIDPTSPLYQKIISQMEEKDVNK